jgi:hypothetical protein
MHLCHLIAGTGIKVSLQIVAFLAIAAHFLMTAAGFSMIATSMTGSDLIAQFITKMESLNLLYSILASKLNSLKC